METRNPETASSALTVELPEAFEKELRDKFNLHPEDILDTIREPEAEERLVMDDLELDFFQRYIPQSPAPYHVLAYGRRIDNILQVNMAWKLQPDFSRTIRSGSPLDIIRKFAMHYGLEISFFGNKSRFFLNRKFIMPNDNKDQDLRIHNPEGHEYVQQIFTRTLQQQQKTVVECALAMCIDMDLYRSAMVTG